MTEPVAVTNTPVQTGPQVLLQKIYLKDASLELPQAPAVFTRNEQPGIDLQLNTAAQNLGNDHHQVTLSLTVTAKLNDATTAFLIEVHQAGIFHVSGFSNPADIDAVLGTFCPHQLFPYAREAVSELVQRAGFPPLLLQPVNFDALYADHRARSGGETAGAAATH